MDIEGIFKICKRDTQSDEYSDTTPSTLKQLDLGKELVKEMLELGITDAHLDEYGIVYGTIKGNGGTGDIIGFIAHMDILMLAELILNLKKSIIMMVLSSKSIKN
ncbi:MAG: hypothetical protein ACLS85_06210 [Coprobacillus cateniformis]